MSARYSYRWGFVWRQREPGEISWLSKMLNLFRRVPKHEAPLAFPSEWLLDIFMPCWAHLPPGVKFTPYREYSLGVSISA